nr:LytTR family DNA-binding domain-containing protein [uncultured Carboxylicivirga sp.]
MMKILLVEDEHLAVKRLESLLKSLQANCEIVSVCDSVKQAVKWLLSGNKPDLAFFDIQLSDGLSFEIFNQAEVTFPVVFTTAYDHYAVKAFEVNGLDYLLKPIEEEHLQRALAKFNSGQNKLNDALKMALMNAAGQLKRNDFKTRYLIKVGEHLKMVETSSISFAYSMDKANYIRTFEGRTYNVDQSLEQMEMQLDPEVFFRISRKFLVNINAIADMLTYGNSRLKLKLSGMEKDDEIIVSRDKVKIFKEWLER